MPAPLLKLATKFQALAAALLFSACSGLGAGDPPAVPSKFTFVKDFVYPPKDWPAPSLATFYKPESVTRTPAVLLIHGGGWTGSDNRNQMTGIAKNLAKRGYAVLNVTYRLTPEWQHPAQVQDMEKALAWLKQNAAAQNIDPDRLATFGYSAGAHLATLLAFQNPTDFKAVVGGGTPSNLALWESGKLVRQLLGGNRDEKPAAYRDASPLTYVTKNSPPVFLYHGSEDTLVPPEHARLLAKKLQEKGVPVTLSWIEGKGHIGTFLFPGEAIDQAYVFLEQHLR